jgi:digeranylgeranylglycerophospholipid reductase
MDEYDALIVGGGPVGSKVGGAIAENGFSTVIVEEHREIGKPVQCSGLVSKSVLELSGTGKKAIIQPMRRAKIICDDIELSMESPDDRVFLIDRSVFDKEMAKNAIKKGSDMVLGARAEAFRRKNGFVETELNVEGERRKIRSKIIIGADGLYSSVVRQFGLDRPKEILGALQAHITDDVDEIRIFPEPEIAFFTWQIPLPDGSLIGSASPSGNLVKLLENRFPDFDRRSISLYGGGIPLGYSKKIVEDNVMTVGDAAAQVKPLSGGGLYPGLRAAELVGKVAVRSLEKGDYSREFLYSYQKEWQATVGKEIRNGMYLRKIYSKMDRNEIKKILSALNDKKLISIIEKEGDIDHPSSLARSLVKSSPKLLVFARYLSGLLI